MKASTEPIFQLAVRLPLGAASECKPENIGQLHYSPTGRLHMFARGPRTPEGFVPHDSWLRFLLRVNSEHESQREGGIRWDIAGGGGEVRSIPAVMQFPDDRLADGELVDSQPVTGTLVLGKLVGAGAGGILREVVQQIGRAHV